MKIIEKKNDQIVFEAKIEDSLANAIRRYVNHIPVIAVDEVNIFKNDSPLYDETLAHRVGLVPLKMDKSVKKEAKLKLTTNKEGMVYSGELKGDVKPVYDNIPLTYINKEQEMEFEATTKMGKGIEHSKFSPGMMFYRNVTEITVDKEFKDRIRNLCPDNEIKEKGNKIIIVDNRKREVTDLCEGICNERDKKAEVEFKDDLIITVESFGQINPEEIFKKSIEELESDLEEVSKKIGKE